jgi:predicted phage-related endonuclease
MTGTADHQEEVVSDIVDLQAGLRGEARPGDEAPAAEDGGAAQSVDIDPVSVATSGLQVTVAPSSAAVAERLAALNARLARLEDSLANVGRRIDEVKPEAVVTAEPETEADARWRSFLDLQRIVADRLDGR